LLKAAEDLMEGVYEEGAYPGDFNLSLVGITNQSEGLHFSGKSTGMLLALWATITTAVNAGTIIALPSKSRQALHEFKLFAEKKQGVVEFRDVKHEGVIAKITPETVIPKPLFYQGNSSLFGKVERVGGALEPKVMLRLPNGKKMYCEATKTIAEEIGGSLYKQVVVEGRATWNSENNQLFRFRIRKIAPFKPTPVSEIFESIRSAIPKTLESWEGRTVEEILNRDD
jgi:hypothetical protein